MPINMSGQSLSPEPAFAVLSAKVYALEHAGMLTHEFAKAFSSSWIAAWNSHDIDRILSHYTDDFVMSSPRIAIVAGEASGILKGREVIGAYWQKALELSPQLQFDHISTFTSADSIVIHYRGVRGLTAEALFFNEQGKVYRAAAHYL